MASATLSPRGAARGASALEEQSQQQRASSQTRRPDAQLDERVAEQPHEDRQADKG